MPRLQIASGQQIESIYRESHRLWGAGLSCQDYVGLWRDLGRTSWGRRNARFYVWLDDRGGILSSMKLYRPQARAAGRPLRLAVLGAIYTPAALRRRGHARSMVRQVLARDRRRGSPLALLFSDIGTSFYESLGFRALPAQEHWSPLRRARGGGSPRGWELREAEPGDAPAIRAAHDASASRRSLAVLRDSDHWEFLRVRAESFFARLADPRVCQRCRVARLRGEFVGYVLSVEGHGEWNVREVGAVDADPSRMADVLRVAAPAARQAGLSRVYGWLPPELVPELSDWRLETRDRSRAVPMLLALDGSLDVGALMATPSDCYIPYQDQF